MGLRMKTKVLLIANSVLNAIAGAIILPLAYLISAGMHSWPLFYILLVSALLPIVGTIFSIKLISAKTKRNYFFAITGSLYAYFILYTFLGNYFHLFKK
jgi:hypothetical protein